MFYLLVSLSLTLLACLRGWFPFALIVFAIPFAIPLLASWGFENGGNIGAIRSLSALGMPGGAVSLAGLSLMILLSRD